MGNLSASRVDKPRHYLLPSACLRHLSVQLRSMLLFAESGVSSIAGTSLPLSSNGCQFPPARCHCCNERRRQLVTVDHGVSSASRRLGFPGMLMPEGHSDRVRIDLAER
jgi:hypothetical protein